MNEPLGDREVLVRQPVHALRRRPQGQPPELRRRRAARSSRRAAVRALPRAPGRRSAASSAPTWRSSSSTTGPVTLLLEHGPLGLRAPMPPDDRFVPRFAAEPPQELLPYGRWADRLREEFLAACLRIDDEGEDLGEAGRDRLVPRPHLARAHLRPGDRAHVARASSSSASSPSRRRRGRRGADGLPARPPTSPTRRPRPTPTGRSTSATRSSARWRGEEGKVAAMTLVWGRPLVDRRRDRHRRARRPRRRPVRADRGPLHAAGARRLPRRHARRQALRRARGGELARESLYEDDDEDADGREAEMELEEAIRTRRTHKAYGAEPGRPRDAATSCSSSARWAPNHHLTNPWRFRVLGPAALARLKAGGAAPRPRAKLDRAPTLVAVSRRAAATTRSQTRRTCWPPPCAAYIVLLGAHARGLAGYWRTPAVLRDAAGRAALGIADDEHADRPAAPRPAAPGAARARARARRATSSASWTDPRARARRVRSTSSAGREREDVARRAGGRPDRRRRRAGPRRRCVRSGAGCAVGRTPPIAKPVGLAHERRVGLAPRPARLVDACSRPTHSTSTGPRRARKTSDLTICPTSQPIAAAARRGARALRDADVAEDAGPPASPLRQRRRPPSRRGGRHRARRSPRRSAGSGRRRRCRPP